MAMDGGSSALCEGERDTGDAAVQAFTPPLMLLGTVVTAVEATGRRIQST